MITTFKLLSTMSLAENHLLMLILPFQLKDRLGTLDKLPIGGMLSFFSATNSIDLHEHSLSEIIYIVSEIIIFFICHVLPFIKLISMQISFLPWDSKFSCINPLCFLGAQDNDKPQLCLHFVRELQFWPGSTHIAVI